MTSKRLHSLSRERRFGDMPQRLALKTLPLAVALCFWAPARADINPVIAGLPMGGTVAAGNVTSDLTGNRLTLTQTGNRAIIDWASFNIHAGKTVEFVQPSATAAVLNRVPASAGMSEIYGTLSANGMVLLMNPNGVLFGQGATINVGSLIASTGTVSVSPFMDDVNSGVITITGATGSVRNEGSITAGNAGLVALVAPSVVNHGSITATGGRIALSGTDRATVTLNGGLYEFALPAGATGTGVSNDAGASLVGAQLLMTTGEAASLLSGVINLEGVQQASSTLVVNGDVVLLKSALDAPTVSGNSNRIEVSPGARVRDAIGIARTGTPGAGATVVLKAGDHTGQLALNKANLTLQGESGARLLVPDAAEVNGITLSAANVTVENLEIVGPVNQPYYDYYATARSNISRGIAVADGVTGFTIRNNNLHDLRTGILIHGRNSTGSVSGNRIENTKSGISVQYTDASGITITGNSQGAIGNEWGLNLHLNGHLDGAGTILSNSTPIAAAPTLTWQQSLMGLSRANSTPGNVWTVQDQGYTTSNRTHVQVAGSGAASNQGSRLTPINTVEGGINAVVSGGTVNVASGSYTQASTLNVNKPLTLVGAGEAVTTLDARGITSGYGMLVTADDVTLRDFAFYGPSAFYASAYGIKVSPSGTPDARLRNFSIMNVTSRGAGKAELDLNGVDGALIDHVTLNGAPVGNDAGSTQGAGLQITDSANVTVRYSTTLNNAWGGLALYQANRSYNQRVNNISIEGNNQFGEINPVYLQDESALHDFGTLSIAGFGYAVRNAASADSGQYTWLQATRQKAYDYAVNLPGVSSSTIQGWDGGSRTQNFEVGIGNLLGGGTQAMSIATAISQSGTGARITLGAGSYNETVSLGSRRNLSFDNVTLQGLELQAGAADSGIGGQVTAQGAGGINVQAPVQLLADTRLATTGADIHLDGHISNAAGVAYSLALVAGSGSNRGNVSMRSGGTESSPLEQFDVSANRYSLSDTLWVQRYQINALGLVALSNHTLRALDVAGNNTLTTSGDVTGSTISLGNVAVQSSGNVTANVSAGGDATVAGNNITGTISGADVAVTAQGNANVEVVATQTATLAAESVSGSVSAPAAVVDSGGGVQLTLNTQTATVRADGPVILSGDSSSLNLDAPGGSVSGNFSQFSNTGGGVITVNGRPEVGQSLADNAGNNRVVPDRSSVTGNVSSDAAMDTARPLGGVFALLEGVPMARSAPSQAGGAIDRGQSVEIDLSPGNEKEQK